MKFLVLFACVAAASASVPLVAYPNGAVAPAKTPSVAAAEAAHFAAKGALPLNALAYNGYAGYPYGAYGAYGAYPYGYGAAYPYGYNGLYAGAYAHGYAAPYAGLVAHPNGAVVPVDEPAVQAAKAEHFAAKGVAPIAAPLAAAPIAYAAAFGYHGLVAHPNGAIVPAEPA